MAHFRNVNQPRREPEPSGAITSRDNRWLKQFRAVLGGHHSDEGLIGVEGVRLVEAALGSGLAVDALLVSEAGERHLSRVEALLSQEVRVLRTTDRLFEGVAGVESPQGIAALVRPRQAAFEDLIRGVPLAIVLVGIQDPGNVGTILRTAEAFGATGAATCAAGAIGTADPFGPKALRASAGSALRLPILRGMSSTVLLTQLRISGVRTYAAVAETGGRAGSAQTDAMASLAPWQVDWKAPAALLIGNEGAGLADEVARSADVRVSIPQAAATAPVGIESLNAAMAATVLLYEAMRQRTAALE